MHVSMSTINRQLKEAERHDQTQTDDKNEANWAEQCLVRAPLGCHQSSLNG
jgi:hypothetical protein